jgi:hypothetical protein
MKGLSQKVLERIAQRRRERNARIIKVVLWVYVLSVIAIPAFCSWEARHKPAWGNFEVATQPSANHYYAARNSDGAPKHVYINGEMWIIVQVSSIDPDRIAAETFCRNKLIVYVNAEDPTELRENLWHEIFHAAGVCAHGSDDWWNSPHDADAGHEGIYHVGLFMGPFSMANPDFMEWASGYK